MKEKRDSQKSKLYKSENKALTPFQTKFKTEEECVKYIDKIYASYYVRKNFPNKRHEKIFVRFGYGGSWARHQNGLIKLSSDKNWAWNDRTALHEIAHILTPNEWHGRVFARAMIGLVKRFMGKEAFLELKKTFDANGVKWRKKKVLTAEYKNVLRERIRNARTYLEPK